MKQVVMIHSVVGEDNADGTSARKYMAGEVLSLDKPWQKRLAQNMIDRGAAMETQGNAAVEETKAAPKKRGRPRKET